MATLTVRLLGQPRIERDGRSVPPPRGHKPWALLAYLVLCGHAPSRRRLAELLFSDANDPLRALRWNLAALRRALGEPEALSGDPVELALRPGSRIDVQVLRSATPEETMELADPGGELLEGMSFPSSPAFESWLLIERRHLAATAEAVLREQVLVELAAARADGAARMAARLIASNPYEEGHHELLVRSLLACGDRAGAAERVHAYEELFRRELGVSPSKRLRDLVRASEMPRAESSLGGPATARAQLEAGRAAVSAGAVEMGIEHLRRACDQAAAAGDDVLHARALLSLGSKLVHAMHGEEGAAALHRAVGLAKRTGTPTLAATGFRELAFLDVQAGRRERADVWLDRAEEAAQGSPRELAPILGVRGMSLSDAARYGAALECFERSVEHALSCDDRRQAAWSLSLAGRVHVLTGNHAAAREALDRALAWVEAEQWIAFLPFPESFRAELDLREERLGEAREGLAHAFTLACQLSDPCWEGLSARGLGMVEERQGNSARAVAWLDDARTRCARVSAPYRWMQGWILDALCEAALEQEHPRASDWIDELATLAARAGMRELVARAYLHRHRHSGEPGAAEAARLLAAEIDNPALDLPEDPAN